MLIARATIPFEIIPVTFIHFVLFIKISRATFFPYISGAFLFLWAANFLAFVEWICAPFTHDIVRFRLLILSRPSLPSLFNLIFDLVFTWKLVEGIERSLRVAVVPVIPFPYTFDADADQDQENRDSNTQVKCDHQLGPLNLPFLQQVNCLIRAFLQLKYDRIDILLRTLNQTVKTPDRFLCFQLKVSMRRVPKWSSTLTTTGLLLLLSLLFVLFKIHIQLYKWLWFILQLKWLRLCTANGLLLSDFSIWLIILIFIHNLITTCFLILRRRP